VGPPVRAARELADPFGLPAESDHHGMACLSLPGWARGHRDSAKPIANLKSQMAARRLAPSPEDRRTRLRARRPHGLRVRRAPGPDSEAESRHSNCDTVPDSPARLARPELRRPPPSHGVPARRRVRRRTRSDAAGAGPGEPVAGPASRFKLL
jgi:hypothetical protein